jgi:hypothetical protein
MWHTLSKGRKYKLDCCGKRPVGRSRIRSVDNIKILLTKQDGRAWAG